MSSARHDRFSNLGVATAGNVLTAGLSLAYVVIVGRRLGPALYADFSAALAVAYVLIAALSPLATVTVQVAAAANVARGRAAALAVWKPLLARAAPAVLPLLLVAALVAPALARMLDIRPAAALYAAIAVAAATAFISVLRNLLRAVGDYGVHATVSTGEAALRLAVGAAIVGLTVSPAWALWAYVIAAAMTSLVLLHMTRSAAAVPALGAIWINLGGALVLSLATALAGNIDVMIARSRLSAEEAGLYGAASTIARGAAHVLAPIEILLLPALAHAGRRLPQTVARLAAYSLLSVGGALAIFAMFSREIVILFFGRAYEPASAILVILALNTAFMFGILLTGQFLLHQQRIGLLSVVAVVPVGQAAALLLYGHSLRSMAMATTAVLGAGFLVAALAAAVLPERARQPRERDSA
jgi:O-antigen/teichoic acid export membrane protein